MPTPIGPDIPPAFRTVLKSLADAIAALQTPAAPQPLFAVTQAGLPPAARHTASLVLVSDLNVLAHSDGAHWIREDTGAVIV